MKKSKSYDTAPGSVNRSATASFPSDGQAVWVRGYNPASGSGTMHLQAQRTDGTRVLAMIQPLGNGDTLPASAAGTLPEHVVELVQESSNSNAYSILNTAVTSLGPFEPTGNNMQWRVASYGSDNMKIGGDRVTPFTAFPTTFTVQVNATCCIWLVYNPGDVSGLSGETFLNNAPKKVVVPDGGWDPAAHAVTTVQLQADGHFWQHGPSVNTQSNAAGRRGEPNMTGTAYTALVSNKIVSTNSNVNALVAVREVDPANATNEELIGFGSSLAVLDPTSNLRAKAIHLGLHDGVKWTDNHGFVLVTVTFI